MRESTAILFLLGLSTLDRHDVLTDPAASVALVGTFEKPLRKAHLELLQPDQEQHVGRFLPRLYRIFHYHRRIMSIGRAIRLMRLLAFFDRRQHYEPADIGKLVMLVEEVVGISDCYPRALLTAYLCLLARRNCKITIGILAPTSKLHAWCSTEGIIPYEPVYHHWWYQPLVVFDVVD